MMTQVYTIRSRSPQVWRRADLSLLALLALVVALAQSCSAQVTTLVSATTAGVEGNGESFITGVSGDGRYVAFSSFADNLIPGGSNGWLQVFRHDANDNSIIDASRAINGDEATIYSWFLTISADGNRVGFTSNSYNLVTLEEDHTFQAYARDVSTGTTILASSDSSGTPGNDESYFSAISGNGRYMAVASFATNLVPNDTNDVDDVFLKDLQTGAITRVSVDSAGNQGNGSSSAPQISYDGRYVIFASDATNLVPNDTNNATDIFVHDCLTGVTERVSISSTGAQSNGGSDWPTISFDGRYAAFECGATNLVTPNTTAGRTNIYVRDRSTGITTIQSVSSTGVYANAGCGGAVLSGNGKYVVFSGDATNLTTDTLHSQTNVFVRRLSTGETRLVSQSTVGVAGNGNSDWATISGDGRVIAFASHSTNLIATPTTGERQIYAREQGPPFTTIRRINSGGPSSGAWSADNSFSGGRPYSTTHSIANAGAVPQIVYQTARTGRFSYNLPTLPNGSYKVILYFQEPTYAKIGMRIFSVYAEGNAKISNLDIYADAGGTYKAISRSFMVDVNDGNGLSLSFVPSKLDALVCGIEIQTPFD